MPRCTALTPPGGPRPSYRGRRAAREAVRVVLLVAAAGAGASLTACGTLMTVEEETLVTGSIAPRKVALTGPDTEAPEGVAAADWTEAKAALQAALAARDKDVSIPWENPATGARGTATPIGQVRDGACRAFMVSVVDKTGDRWVRGEACRAKDGFTLSEVRILGRA